MRTEANVNQLFVGHVDYNGRGRAEFSQPRGAVEGVVSAHFDENGNSGITMTVDHVEVLGSQQSSLMELFSGLGRNTCTSLTVESPAGMFSIKEGIHVGFSLGGSSKTVTFHPLRSQFNSSARADARYWLLPLSNFVSRFPTCHPDLQAHPLRLRLSETLVDSGRCYTDRVITFDSCGQLGYVQPLLNYEARVADLEEGRERHRVTALMIGNAESTSVSEGEWESWFPFDFFRLMSLATGVSVGAPWIEFRDAAGHLVSRVHRNFELASFNQGHRAIEEGINSGLGYLLTRYQDSADRGNPFLNVALKHVIGAASNDGSVEDTTVYLSRALEGVCDRYGFKTQYLLDQLDEQRQSEVIAALEAAMRQIRGAAKSAARAGFLDQARQMQKIADRVRSNSANKDTDFGLAVTQLLKHFDFPDADIIDAFYQGTPRSDGIPTWASVLSHYRGTIMHSGHYKFSDGTHDIDDVIRINYHLLDILIRIILKIVGYDGTYQSPVIRATNAVPVDWVTSDLPADRLGYNTV